MAATWPLWALQPQGLSKQDATRIDGMLKDAYESIRKYYYDASLRGLDWDERYEEFRSRIETAPSLNAGLGIVAAFVDGLEDSHTYFQPPNWSKTVDYGYDVGIVGDDPYVLRVKPKTDAASKLRPGDRVISINDNQVTRESFSRMQYILNLLSPQVATKVVVRGDDGVEREELVQSKVIEGRALTVIGGPGAPLRMSDLIRDMEMAQYQMRPRSAVFGDVLIAKMPTFFAERSDIDGLISKARKAKTMIIDLRDNPGGFIEALRRLAGGLFAEDQLIGTRVTRGGRTPLSAPTRGKDAFTGRLIVLIDSGSGSSAELFARVVQLEGRGQVIGDRSSGRVKEARFFPFSQGRDIILTYGVSITSADVLMADGGSLEGVGVTPDTVMLPTAGDLFAGRDPVLSHAARLAGASLDPLAAAKLFQDRR
jgi:C-terminal processing protease CtpA/Prc